MKLSSVECQLTSQIITHVGVSKHIVHSCSVGWKYPIPSIPHASVESTKGKMLLLLRSVTVGLLSHYNAETCLGGKIFDLESHCDCVGLSSAKSSVNEWWPSSWV